MDKEAGMLVVSKAGHDKGSVYVILEAKAAFARLIDGRKFKPDCGKKKNRKHFHSSGMFYRDLLKEEKKSAKRKLFEENDVALAIRLYERRMREGLKSDSGKE